MAKDPFRQLDVLKNIVNNGNKVKDCYRLMYNKKLWLRALHTIGKTRHPDHIQLIDESIEKLKTNTFRLSVKERLIEILVKEVVRMILTSIISPLNLRQSQLNRKNYNIHSALNEIRYNWSHLTWGIKGDWLRFPQQMNKQKLMDILSEKISDQRFLLLIHHLAKNIASNEEMSLKDTDIHGNVSLYDLLTSIYLHPLDLFMEKTQYLFETRKRDFKKSTNFHHIQSRKLTYIRYAGEFLIGISGSKQEAKEIKNHVELYLRTELKLMPRKEAVLKLTHFEKGILFLDYLLRIDMQQKKSGVTYKTNKQNQNRSSLSKQIKLEIPRHKIAEFAMHKNYGEINTFTAYSRSNILYNTELNILRKYNAELRAISYYYKLADSNYQLRRLFYLAQASFLMTIAKKRRTTVSQVARNLKKHKQGMYCLSCYDRDGNKQLYSLIKFDEMIKKLN